MKYYYKIENEEIALNEEEHRYMLDLIGKGKSGLAVLRGGNLIINMAFIRKVTIDEEEFRLEQQAKLPKLPEPSVEATAEQRKRIDEALRKARENLNGSSWFNKK